MRPKDTVDPAKQDGVVYKIPCECGKVYIGETGRSMHERIDRDIRLARTQTSAVSEHVRLHPDNINRDSGIEIPEAWMSTIKKHNRRTVQQRTTEGATSRRDSEDRNAPITIHHRYINGTA